MIDIQASQTKLVNSRRISFLSKSKGFQTTKYLSPHPAHTNIRIELSQASKLVRY